MIDLLKKQLYTVHQKGKEQVSEACKFIGPGIIVTVMNIYLLSVG
mgnify:CR=1 FL=1